MECDDNKKQRGAVSASKENCLTRKRGQIHPDLVADYGALRPLKVLRLKTVPKQYGTLTDKSPYAAYAWEFLRRNRFYQAMIDKVKPSFSIDDWGYRPAAVYAPSCGLVEAALL